jgi:hypothetical protein
MTVAAGLSLADLEAFDPRPSSHGAERRYCCPLADCAAKPVDREHRSLSVNVTTGAWLCHRCGGRGLLAEHRVERSRQARSGRQRARDGLRRAFRVPDRPAPPPEQATAPADGPSPRWRRRLRGLAPIAGTPGASYLQARGIPTEVATAARVGFAPAWEQRMKRDDGTWELRTDRRVVFPIRDARGRLVGLSARAIDPTFVGPKVHTVGKVKPGVFATDGALEADPIVVCEAAIDALSLAACGVPAIALNGTAWPDWLPRAAALRDALLATDADERGERAVADLVGALTLGSRCARLRPPVGKDWNETLVALGREALAESLRRDRVGERQHGPAPTRPAAESKTVAMRCLIRGCAEPVRRGDLAYCAAHRLRADDGTLWRADPNGDADRPEDRLPSRDAAAATIAGLGPPLDGLLATLRDRGAQLYVEHGRLRYAGPGFAPADPILKEIAEHRRRLVELFTYASAGRCTVEGCFRLPLSGVPSACLDHRRELDGTSPATEGAAGRVGT